MPTGAPAVGLPPRPPAFDFDGNPTEAATQGHVEVSRVRIHPDDEDEGEAGEAAEGRPDQDGLDTADLLAAELQHARQRVIECELRLGLQPTVFSFAAGGNTTHRPRDHSTNDMSLPIVPVEAVLHEVEMTKNGPFAANGADAAVPDGGIHGGGTPTKKVVLPAAAQSVPACFSRRGVVDYFRKWQGQHVDPLPMSPYWDILLAFIASWIGIAVPALLHYNMLYTADHTQYLFLIASFGATAVLVYAAPMSDFSQPRNVFFGHTLSAVVGVCVRHLVFPDAHQLVSLADDDFRARQWLACAIAVSFSITLMHLTRTLHPPGGATALQAVLINTQVHDLDWRYIGFIGVTAVVMIIIGIIFNNLPRKKIYPKFWY